MKKIKLYLFFIAVISTTLYSCKKDDGSNSKELFAYIKSDNIDPNKISLPFTNTNNVITGEFNGKFSINLTRESSSDISLKLNIDEAKVNSYNIANKTDYKLLPSSNYNLANTTLTVKSGKTASVDTLKIQIIDRAKLNNDFVYILPISIGEISGGDKGLRASGNRGTLYVIVEGMTQNVDAANAGLTGTPMVKTNWSATATSSNSASFAADLAIDGNNSTSWISASNGLPAAITIDMKTIASNINGFNFYPYNSTSYTPLNVDVYSSLDGVKWKMQGNYISTSTAINTKIIKFISPVSSRYFRFNITKANSTQLSGFAEINAIQ